ncbi:hypothetical protein ACLESD_25425 [Pyxidicoccus sp. 3LFB2]
MKSAIKFLRAVAMVSATLALTACGGEELAGEELASVDTETLASSEAELGSCANWSEWSNTGQAYCDYRSCGFRWECGYVRNPNGDTSARAEQDENIIYCEDGTVAMRVYNPGTFSEQSSYRVCFNEAGTYTHTEYQYRSVLATCGC